MRREARALGRSLVVAALVWAAISATGSPDALVHLGKSYLFDYGDVVIRVRYLTASRLEWEQVKGPQTGLKAQEEYGHSAIRADVVFFWWQEKDQGVVTQVVDFGKGIVHTTWTSSERKLTSFQGKVRPLE
jgi:molybdenum cofactor biosynthesis MoaF-like protein